MPWNSTWPVGNASVKANESTGTQNTTYIKTTMGGDAVGTNTTSTRDHFWGLGSDEDGRHRFIQSPAFTVGGSPDDPVVGTAMDAVLYAKTTNSQSQWFRRNSDGIYQVSPNVLTGTKTVTSSYSTLVSVPANTYGDIFMYRTADTIYSGSKGFFKSNGTIVQSWGLYQGPRGQGASLALKFGNGADANLLNIQVRSESAQSGNSWNYIVTYRSL